MKILSIRGKNMASLEGEFSIDFTEEPLLSAGIFAITGPTGAGKSTILDTLCLALYGEIPRQLGANEKGVLLKDGLTGTILPNDPRAILRKGTSDGFAEVKFKGNDSNDYRATWKVWRSKNKIEGALQAPTVSLENLTTNTPVQGTRTEISKEIERVLGLSFPQFTRSVLLAQGDFTAFLKANKDSKSELLETLTGTAIYSEISKLIFDKFRVSEKAINELKAQLGGILLLKENERHDLIVQKSKVDLALKTIQLEQESLKLQLGWHTALKSLMDSKADAVISVCQAKEAKASAKERSAQFLLIESVQDARIIFATNQTLEKDVAEKKEALNTHLLGEGEFKKQLEQASLNQKHFEVEHQASQTNYETSQPQIEAAKRLDTIIGSKAGPLKEAKDKWDLTAKTRNAQDQEIFDKNTAIGLLNAQIESVNTWLKANEARKSVAEDSTLVLSKLADAAELLETQELAVGQQAALKAEIKIKDVAIAAELKLKQEAETELGQATANFGASVESLKLILIDEIKINEKTALKKSGELTKAKGCWDLLFDRETRYNEQTLLLAEISKNRVKAEADYNQAGVDLKEAEIKKKQAERLLSSARLKTAENVATLRSSLILGDPCLVCGSTDHPYSAPGYQPDAGLKVLEEEELACNHHYEQLVADRSKFKQLDTGLKLDEAKITKELIQVSEKITTLTLEWEKFSLFKECASVASAERSHWLEIESEKVNTELTRCQKQIKAYDTQKELKEQLEKDHRTKEKRVEEMKNGLLEFRQQRNLDEQNLAHTEKALKESQAELEVIIAALDLRFKEKQWSTTWKQNPTAFIAELTEFRKAWCTHSDQLINDTTECAKLGVGLVELEKHLRETIALEAKGLSEFTRLTEEISADKASRVKLFGGQDIKLIEDGFKKNVSTAERGLDAARKQSGALQDKMSISSGTIAQSKKDLSTTETRLLSATQDFDKWLIKFNATRRPPLEKLELKPLLSLSSEWIAGEREALQALESAILAAETTLRERDTNLSAHKLKKGSAKTLDEVSERAAIVESDYDKQCLNQKDVDYKLRLDGENQKKSGGLQSEMTLKDLIYQKWAKLNELLGSSDGKKFRQIAQEFTLEILLSHANVQLEKLTSRYQLECIPDSLALQIIDRDMGDEIRSVHTLSGGESFLVSLALALGLAALSADKMQVESLFIDEGFGSLDPDTLATAMSALDNLHNQGRKVGVITHVQEMTDNILTQVKVSKFSSGKSKVEVHPLQET